MFVALLTLLAVCRITRLIVEDSITQPLRQHIYLNANPPPGHAPRGLRLWRLIETLTSCVWCAGFWVSVIATLGYFRCWGGVWPWESLELVWAYAAAVLACSWASALLAEWLDAPPPPRAVTLTHLPAHVDVTTRQDPSTTPTA